MLTYMLQRVSHCSLTNTGLFNMKILIHWIRQYIFYQECINIFDKDSMNLLFREL